MLIVLFYFETNQFDFFVLLYLIMVSYDINPLTTKGPRKPKRLFAFLGSYCECNKFLDFLKLFVTMRLAISFAGVQISYFSDLRVKSYGCLKCLGQVRAANFLFIF
jgi:hypothetical protein